MITQRFDSVPIREPIVDKMTGFLHVKRVPIAQVMVQPYLKADGSIDHEAKLPNEILSDSTVASANNKPVTDNHPGELVNKNNSKEYIRGLTDSNAHVEGNMLYNDITITDSDLIDKIVNQGKRELSIGFQAEIVPQSGELNGVKYDSVQKNIRINHVAVVERGRAGHKVRLLGDSAEAITKGENQMELTQVRVDGVDIKVDKDDADKVSKLGADNKNKQALIDKYTTQIKELNAKIEALQGKSDGAQNKADEAEKKLAEMKKKYEGDALDQRVAKRIDLIEQVKPYVGDSFDFKGKNERALKEAAIKAVKGDSFDLTDKSDGYIDGYFASLDKPHSTAGYHGPEVKGDQALEDEADKAISARQNLYEGGNK